MPSAVRTGTARWIGDASCARQFTYRAAAIMSSSGLLLQAEHSLRASDRSRLNSRIAVVGGLLPARKRTLAARKFQWRPLMSGCRSKADAGRDATLCLQMTHSRRRGGPRHSPLPCLAMFHSARIERPGQGPARMVSKGARIKALSGLFLFGYEYCHFNQLVLILILRQCPAGAIRRQSTASGIPWRFRGLAVTTAPAMKPARA